MMDIERLHDFLKAVDSEVEGVRRHRQEGKLDFNFFTALVSGKYAKEHIEKYHSNFIGYLLDPHGSHGFGSEFLSRFLMEIGLDLADCGDFVVEREHLTTNGRLIDIIFYRGCDIPLFIENKVGSSEVYDQMKDYFEYASKFNNVCGVYLTLDGSPPASISREHPGLRCVSYHEIRSWLLLCMESLGMPVHIKHIEMGIKIPQIIA